MSDYSFLKTGFNIVNDNNQSDNITEKEEQIQGLQAIVFSFMENAIKTSEEYVKHSGRNSITKEDIKLCLKAETFDYLERSDVVENVKKWRRIIAEDSESDTESDFDDEVEDLDAFKVSTCNCITCEKLNNIDEKWEQWEPQEGLETILHNAIIKHL